MANLATIEDLEARLGRDVDDTTRADTALKDASAAVRSYTGQHFSAATTTVRLVPKRGVVKLPQRPVTAVSAVEDVNGNALLYEWLGSDTVEVSLNLDSFSFEPWSNGIRVVDVTYTHGGTVPDDIVGVVCNVALRAIGVAADDSGLTGESLGDYSYTRGAAAAQGALAFLVGERAILDRYRRQTGTVTVSA